jgi:hypothetical protein
MNEDEAAAVRQQSESDGFSVRIGKKLYEKAKRDIKVKEEKGSDSFLCQ